MSRYFAGSHRRRKDTADKSYNVCKHLEVRSRLLSSKEP